MRQRSLQQGNSGSLASTILLQVGHRKLRTRFFGIMTTEYKQLGTTLLLCAPPDRNRALRLSRSDRTRLPVGVHDRRNRLRKPFRQSREHALPCGLPKANPFLPTDLPAADRIVVPPARASSRG